MSKTEAGTAVQIIFDQALELEGMMFERTRLKAANTEQNTLQLDKRINELAMNIHNNLYTLSGKDYRALDRRLKENEEQFTTFTMDPLEELKALGREAAARETETQTELLRLPKLPEEREAKGKGLNVH